MAGKSSRQRWICGVFALRSHRHKLFIMSLTHIRTDEVRRSGRATKGQHTKANEEPEPVKKRGRGRQSKAAKEEEEGADIIRCICGYIKEDKRDKRPMICCDTCSAWQHNICMGVSDDEDEIPDNYWCEKCKPEDHRETLAAIERGENIWEERQARHKQEEEEERARKRKKGKKGKGGRASEVKEDGEADSAQSPAAKPQVSTPKADAPQKRKLPSELQIDSSVSQEQVRFECPQIARTAIDFGQSAAKLRKVTTPKDAQAPKDVKPRPRRNAGGDIPSPKATKPQRRDSKEAPQRRDSKDVPFQSELVENIADLHDDNRQKAAKALVGIFVDATKQATQQGKFSLPPGQSADAFGNKLGLAVEYALCLNHWGHGPKPNPPYGEKLRTIRHNVKANTNLRDNLLSGALSPNELTRMSTDQMMRQDLKEATAQILEATEKQHMIVHEEGPRIRRTHKGDEVVGDDSHVAGANEPIYTGVGRRRESRIDDDSATSPLSPMKGGRPLTVDTKSPTSPDIERKASANFDMNHVWSSVESPADIKQPPPHVVPESAPSPSGTANADPEIAHLLADDDEAYSPKSYNDEGGDAAEPPRDGIVWRGTVTMPMVASFQGTAQHVAGADLAAAFPWATLLRPTVAIEGRIDTQRAGEYLCGLQWSKTTDVTIAAVTARTATDRAEFDKLFAYFVDRERYGVVTRATEDGAVKDVYAVPLERGDARKPDFVELLETCTLPDVRDERALLLVFVVKTREPPPASTSAQATPRQPDFANSPVAGRGAPPPPSANPLQSPPQAGGLGIAPPPGGAAAPQRTGWDAARAVLGELAGLPVVAQLLRGAPEAPEQSFLNVKKVLETQPETHGDWTAFQNAAQRMMGSRNP